MKNAQCSCVGLKRGWKEGSEERGELYMNFDILEAWVRSGILCETWIARHCTLKGSTGISWRLKPKLQTQSVPTDGLRRFQGESAYFGHMPTADFTLTGMLKASADFTKSFGYKCVSSLCHSRIVKGLSDIDYKASFFLSKTLNGTHTQSLREPALTFAPRSYLNFSF